MGKGNSRTVRTYSKRCPLKVMQTSSTRLTTPDALEEGGSTLPTPATPSYIKDLTPPTTSSEAASTVGTGTGGRRTRSSASGMCSHVCKWVFWCVSHGFSCPYNIILSALIQFHAGWVFPIAIGLPYSGRVVVARVVVE